MRPVQVLLTCLVLVAGLAVYFAVDHGEPVEGVPGHQGSRESSEGAQHVLEAPGVQTERTELETRAIEEPVVVAEEVQSSSAARNKLTGLVIDTKGEPLADCEVVFFGEGLESTDAPTYRTEMDGRFTFTNLPPGDRHSLLVRCPRVLVKVIHGIVVGDFGDFEEAPIVLRQGKHIVGKVESLFGLPIGGARLHLDEAWLPNGPEASVDRITVLTDDYGLYEIHGAPDGKRCLTVEADGFGTMTRIQSLTLSDKTGQKHLVNFVLAGRAKLNGQVINLEGQALLGAEVSVIDRRAYRDVPNDRALTAADGTFSVESIQAGVFELRVSAAGYETLVQRNVQLPLVDTTIMLQASPRIAGQVVRLDTGAAVTEFSLRLREVPNFALNSIARGESQAISGAVEGKFTIPALSPSGTWVLEAQAAGFAPRFSEPFMTNDFEDVSGIQIALARGGSLSGRLVDALGRAVGGARVTTRDNDWSNDAFAAAAGDEQGSLATTRETRSAGDGTFAFTNLSPGVYQILANAENMHQAQRGALVVEEGADQNIGDVVTNSGAHLRGVLYSGDQAPVSAGLVFLKPVGAAKSVPVRRVRSGATGEWQLKDIVPGTYLLSAKAPSDDRGAFALWPSNGGDELVLESGVLDTRNLHLEDWGEEGLPAPLPPAGSLQGKVSGPSGEALDACSLELIGIGSSALARRMSKSASDGAFSFGGIRPGKYALFATGHDETRVQVTIVADETTNQDLQLLQ